MIPDIHPEEYTYELHEEQIAKYPLPHRDHAKLLVYQDGNIRTQCFCDLDHLLHKDDVLIINNTKVIRARLFFHKSTGAKIEIFCLEPVHPADYEQIFSSREPVIWECLIGNAKKWKNGKLTTDFLSGDIKIRLTAEKIRQKGNASQIRFSWDASSLTFGQVLELAGGIPIPPYLNRDAEPSDLKEYQTVYALREGSVAAPTAGLHFTPEMMGRIKRDFLIMELTLHVGAGTFKPIQTERIEDHIMHTEHFAVNRAFLENIITKNRRIIAIGTTTVRTLESLFWLAVKIYRHGTNDDGTLFTDQWDPYQHKEILSSAEAIEILLAYMQKNHLSQLNGSTRLMIVPGYRFRLVNGMVTNFHLPKSTLLLLIAAFTGDNWKKIYHYALANNYRFLSYGDAQLLLP